MFNSTCYTRVLYSRWWFMNNMSSIQLKSDLLVCWAGQRMAAHAGVRCIGTVNGSLLSKLVVHEMSMEKNSYTALLLLQNRLLDWQQTLYDNSSQADGKITICSSVSIRCGFPYAAQLHDLPAQRVCAALCKFYNTRTKAYGLILWLVLIFHLVKKKKGLNLPPTFHNWSNIDNSCRNLPKS